MVGYATSSPSSNGVHSEKKGHRSHYNYDNLVITCGLPQEALNTCNLLLTLIILRNSVITNDINHKPKGKDLCATLMESCHLSFNAPFCNSKLHDKMVLAPTIQNQRYHKLRQLGSRPTNHPPLSPFLSWKGEEKVSGGHPQCPRQRAVPSELPMWTGRYADL